MTLLEGLRSIFAGLCHQLPERTWAPGGEALPFCQRCTGLYVGAAIGLALLATLRPRRSNAFLAAHAALVSAAVPFGLGWIPHGASVRTIAGMLFGCGLTALLVNGVTARAAPSPTRGGRRTAAYGVLLGAAAGTLPAILESGGAPVAGAIGLLGAAGLAALGVLAMANVAVLATGAIRRLRSTPRPAAQETQSAPS